MNNIAQTIKQQIGIDTWLAVSARNPQWFLNDDGDTVLRFRFGNRYGLPHFIEITYRPYLSNDLEGPQMDPPITLVLTEVEADVQRVTARARMMDIGNKAFPSRTYTAREFPGLTR